MLIILPAVGNVYGARPTNTVPTVAEIVLPYDRAIVPQERFYDCGPAAAQIVLNGLGIFVSEAELIRRIGTDEEGTDYVGLIEVVLAEIVPTAKYTSAYLSEPTSKADKDTLLARLDNSIRGGRGAVLNFVSPPNNRPRGVKGSVSPNYGWNTVWHYVACMGVDVDERAIWIADSGFQPQGYWLSVDQAATLIAPKGYCWASAPAPAPVVTPPPKPAPSDPLFASRSPYRDSDEAFMSANDVWLNIDARTHAGLDVEPAALRGEMWAIEKVALLAAGKGPGAVSWVDKTTPDTQAIARAQSLLLAIQSVNPRALDQYLTTKGAAA